jgi:hypothetical protein
MMTGPQESENAPGACPRGSADPTRPENNRTSAHFVSNVGERLPLLSPARDESPPFPARPPPKTHSRPISRSCLGLGATGTSLALLLAAAHHLSGPQRCFQIPARAVAWCGCSCFFSERARVWGGERGGVAAVRICERGGGPLSLSRESRRPCRSSKKGFRGPIILPPALPARPIGAWGDLPEPLNDLPERRRRHQRAGLGILEKGNKKDLTRDGDPARELHS